ncbi:DUF5666 domain-containing protein [Variovorax boronicumulans]|uniref:DUF5666 domain-containing protein n=1 Tax=Variovorax boronicumulans TaxID=436515 RepID=UPI0012E528B3|nr:DUF5666 domain-containing protein [Variovorax boronicumulans]GER20091.1 hypothetical protein VCH24_51280 [Variovorax boronicumulans]
MNTPPLSLRLVRGLLMAGAMALLLSCGGGGGGSGGGGTLGFGTTGTTATGNGNGGGGGDGGSGDAGSGSGTGNGSTGSTGGGGDSTAGNTNGDGSGVGSGGTGVTADAAGIGAADGLGSVILNGLRYNTDSATFSLEDTTELQIGMSARIAGKVDANFTSGIAATVVSAAELRGAVSAIDLKDGSFTVMGARVTTDNATVWGDAKGATDLVDTAVVQVWGLPAAPGILRATRVQVAPATTAPLVTGTVQNLDRGGQQFTLGLLTIDFGGAAFGPGIDAASLANGAIVRVRGTAAPAAGRFTATQVQGWYAIPSADGIALQLAGVITDFAALGDFRVLGNKIDARNAQITGGPSGSIGNGVKVEVDGFLSGQVLVVKKLRIRHVPGTGGPVSFTVIGAIGGYVSAADFTVRGQRVDASGSGTIFENGTATDLGNGKRVTVVGDRVVDGVLIAQRVSFTLP